MTDTNQASEELREIFINRMWNYFGIEDKSELAHFGTIYDQAVAPIIRTEKLKLLAEVRERVVGEDERLDIQSDYDKLDVPHPETDRYPGLDGVRQASRNLCRGRQRAALTKLEAEL